ncbi:MAG: sigma-70 family RNA polymerase sigma factor [Firmicutes bacterium]|nr:sigma-70 family RNA polymerase sigma factor [Bacillota bacterium]
MNKQDLSALILDSERLLYATARTILLNDQDCQDAVQETIVKAFTNLRQLKKDRYARTWLVRILINECYDVLRRGQKIISLEASREAQERPSPVPEDYSDLYRAVEDLPEDLRIPVVLYYIDDFSVREIAGMMDISEGAVQKRLARARGKLRVALEGTAGTEALS